MIYLMIFKINDMIEFKYIFIVSNEKQLFIDEFYINFYSIIIYTAIFLFFNFFINFQVFILVINAL
jgi:hypothetical protein